MGRAFYVLEWRLFRGDFSAEFWFRIDSVVFADFVYVRVESEGRFFGAGLANWAVGVVTMASVGFVGGLVFMRFGELKGSAIGFFGAKVVFRPAWFGNC